MPGKLNTRGSDVTKGAKALGKKTGNDYSIINLTGKKKEEEKTEGKKERDIGGNY